MKVVSLFDGMGCGLEALKRAGISVSEYHAFEVDKHAIKIAKKNHPEIIHHGEINFMTDFSYLKGADLLIGGSPCQGFSFAGKQLNFNDPRSALFFEFVRAKREIKPKNFLLENVKMKKEYLNIISDNLGVKPTFINSALVSAQNRQRYYWCNWKVEQPEDKGILLKDIVHEKCDVDRDKSYCLDANYWKGGSLKNYFEKSRRQIAFEEIEKYIVPFDKTLQILDKEVERGKVGYFNKGSQGDRVYYTHDKSVTLTGHGGGLGAKTGLYLFGCITPDRVNKRQDGQRFNDGQKFYTLTAQDKRGVLVEGYIRKLTPIESERLQTLPDNYTEGVSNSQRYKMLGNGWTVDVITHLLKGIKI